MLGVYYFLFLVFVLATAIVGFYTGYREGVSETINQTLNIGEESHE